MLCAVIYCAADHHHQESRLGTLRILAALGAPVRSLLRHRLGSDSHAAIDLAHCLREGLNGDRDEQGALQLTQLSATGKLADRPGSAPMARLAENLGGLSVSTRRSSGEGSALASPASISALGAGSPASGRSLPKFPREAYAPPHTRARGDSSDSEVEEDPILRGLKDHPDAASNAGRASFSSTAALRYDDSCVAAVRAHL